MLTVFLEKTFLTSFRNTPLLFFCEYTRAGHSKRSLG